MNELEAVKSILRRERQARKAAEQVIEEKARELYFANEALKKLNGSLEETVRERTSELTIAKEKAEYATKAKSEFLSSMSHEIRTPLNAISGLSDLIERDSKEPEIQEYAAIVKDSVLHLLTIINEILDFSKIESGKFEMDLEDFVLRDMRNQIFHTYSPLAQKKELEFNITFDPLIPKVIHTDKTKILQVWINLLGNAIKFTDKGCVSARLSVMDREGDTIWLQGCVKDSGMGIPEGDLERVFQPFEQSEQGENGKIGGTGLGLAITQKVLKMLGGTIEVSSKKGKGSEFRFTVPVKEGDSSILAKKETRSNNHTDLLKGLKILVVDDMEMNRFLMRKVLKRVNAEAHFAENGAKAVEWLEQESFDVVLMDLHMPVMDGREATRTIRERKIPLQNPSIPIVALTADAFKRTHESVIEAGMNDFLPKPINIDLLYEKLARLL